MRQQRRHLGVLFILNGLNLLRTVKNGRILFKTEVILVHFIRNVICEIISLYAFIHFQLTRLMLNKFITLNSILISN